MKNLLGAEIPEDVLGILYLCNYCFITNKLTPIQAREYNNPGRALEAYANIPNAPSQLAYGRTREEFELALQELHNRMLDRVWQESLGEYL